MSGRKNKSGRKVGEGEGISVMRLSDAKLILSKLSCFGWVDLVTCICDHFADVTDSSVRKGLI